MRCVCPFSGKRTVYIHGGDQETHVELMTLMCVCVWGGVGGERTYRQVQISWENLPGTRTDESCTVKHL